MRVASLVPHDGIPHNLGYLSHHLEKKLQMKHSARQSAHDFSAEDTSHFFAKKHRDRLLSGQFQDDHSKSGTPNILGQQYHRAADGEFFHHSEQKHNDGGSPKSTIID
jgi:hypothetical protein